MSAALNLRPDSSTHSATTLPDLSFSSLVSGISTPGRALRAPSAASQTTAPSSAPLSTPSPPVGHHATSGLRKRLDVLALSGRGDDDGIDDSVDAEGAGAGAGYLDTPVAKLDGPETPVARRRTRGNATGGKGVTLTLRDQEKVRYSYYYLWLF